MLPPKGVRLSEKLQHSVMKFDRSNKFEFCYYGQVNTFGGIIYFAGDGTEAQWSPKLQFLAHLFCKEAKTRE